MKRLFYYLLFGPAILACSPSSSYQHQLAEVETIIEENPDSARALWYEIPFSLLQEGRERALYNLLLTMADYKLYKPFTDDSLIRYSVDYYEKSKNTDRLSSAYYYLGVINYDELKNIDEAVKYLKKAEELSQNGNELLRNKIFELLHSINYNANNINLSLQYADLFLDSSKKLGNPELISRAYEHLSNDYIAINNEDLAAKYIKQSLNFADQCTDLRKSYLYGNYANYLMGTGHYSEAEEYVNRAILLHPLPNHYIMLGRISRLEGDTLQARKHWEKAMTFDNQRFTIKAYRLMADMCAERGNHPEAFRMMEIADSLKDAYHEQMRTTQLTEIQHRYDTAIMEKALTERKNFWLTLTIMALAALVAALIAIIFISRRTKAYQGIINQDIERIYQAEQQIELLREQIGELKETSAQKLGRGKSIYDDITASGKVVDFTRPKEQDFIDYYAYTFSDKFHALIKPYKDLTLRHTTYLVLQQMGKDDRQIGELLNVSAATIRGYRHRLKEKD